MMNLAAALQRNASCKPDKVALICGDTQMTYAQFDAMAGKIASGLIDNGIQPGDRVALSCPNLPFSPWCITAFKKQGQSSCH
jgi:long-chain acyl-CoA synthetase